MNKSSVQIETQQNKQLNREVNRVDPSTKTTREESELTTH